jgi:hypothetical protein
MNVTPLPREVYAGPVEADAGEAGEQRESQSLVCGVEAVLAQKKSVLSKNRTHDLRLKLQWQCNSYPLRQTVYKVTMNDVIYTCYNKLLRTHLHTTYTLFT